MEEEYGSGLAGLLLFAALVIIPLGYTCKVIGDVSGKILKKGKEYLDGFWTILLIPFLILSSLRTPFVFLPLSLVWLETATKYFFFNTPISITHILTKTICYILGLVVCIACYETTINKNSKIKDILTDETRYLVIDKEEFDNHKCLIKILKHLSTKYAVHLPDLEDDRWTSQEITDRQFKELEKAEKEIANIVDYCIDEYIKECGFKEEKSNSADEKISS